MENQLISLQDQYNNSIALFQNGSQILVQNELLISKIRASGQSIINKIQANEGKLTPELDKLCNDFIAKANQRLKEMNEARAPITQMLTAVQKMFTSLEAQLDIKKPDTEMAILQSFRNEYAKQIAEEQRKKKEEAERQAKKAQEAISIKSNVETQLSQYFNSYVAAEKQKIQNRFNSLTLAEFDSSIEKLKELNPVYQYEHFKAFAPSIQAFYNDKAEIENIVLNSVTGKFDGFCKTFIQELSEFINSLLARSASKKSELIALAEADAEEKERLEKEQLQRQKAEEERIKREAEEAQKQAELQAQSQAAAEETMVLFEKEAALAVDTPAPATRQGYEIEVLHPAAWVQIFQLWWEHEGKSLEAEKIEKKTMSAMKKACESLAHKKNIKIESQFLKYNETFKAVNKK